MVLPISLRGKGGAEIRLQLPKRLGPFLEPHCPHR